MTFINGAALDTLFLLGIIALLAVTLLLIMDCIWRTEGKFDKYLKLIACAFVLLLIKNTLLLFGFRTYESWSIMLRALEFLQVVFFLFSNIELLIIIRSLSGENELNESKEEI